MKKLCFILCLFLLPGVSARAAEEDPLAHDTALLEKLINISSETQDIAGVSAVINAVEEEARGISAKFTFRRLQNKEIDPATSKPKYADALVIEYPGKKPEYITLISHADTVFKAVDGKVATPFSLTEDGKKILGSGCGDDKGGIVVALRALRTLLAAGEPPYSLRLIVAANEEVGSPGHRESYAELAKDSHAILGVEPSNGDIITGRGGVHWYQVEITGKEAHAGIHHEQGVNACLDLALKIARYSKLTNYGKKRKVNVGTIEGGKKPNIVCGFASAKIDTRFATAADNRFLEKSAKRIFLKPQIFSHDGTKQGTQTELKSLVYMPAFHPNLKVIEPYLNRYLAKVKEIEGKKYGKRWSGGGADVSYMVGHTDLMMDSFGPVTDGSHTSEEYILTDSLRTRSEALVYLLNHI